MPKPKIQAGYVFRTTSRSLIVITEANEKTFMAHWVWKGSSNRPPTNEESPWKDCKQQFDQEPIKEFPTWTLLWPKPARKRRKKRKGYFVAYDTKKTAEPNGRTFQFD